MSTLTDRFGLIVNVDTSNDGTQPTVIIRYGSKARRTFTAQQWAALDAIVRERFSDAK